MSMLIGIFIKYAIYTYSQYCSQLSSPLWIKKIEQINIHKDSFFFYTVYRVVDNRIPQAVDFVDNIPKYVAIPSLF